MKIKMIPIIIITLTSFPCVVRAQGNLVVNGGFNSGSLGWVLTNGASLSAPFQVGQTGYTVSLDNLYPSISALPTASQTIGGLTPLTSYIISGNYMMGKDRLADGSPANPSFGVLIDDVVYFQVVSPGNFNTIYSFSFLYTATDSSAVLSLSAQMNGTGVSYFVDNISMYAVPEPTTITLFGLSVASLGLWWRRNQCKRVRRCSRPTRFKSYNGFDLS